MPADSGRRLSAAQVADVVALVDAAAAHDHVGPLSEQARLAVRHGGLGSHHLRYAGSRLAGYAHLDDGPAPAAELVVHPEHRRRGVASGLLASLHEQVGPLLCWSHGRLPAAAAFAAARGYPAVRELLQLRRTLSTPLPAAALPDGFHVRAFEVGRDEQAWLAVNAAAFADHPEQARISLADLRQREGEAWFDPAGFFLVEEDGDPPRLAAFHWTKVHPATPVTEAVGEVYAIGVHPAYQGRGLGRAVTAIGVRHVAELGLGEAMLYVEADNAAGLATYRRLGFEVAAVDVVYATAARPADRSRGV
ncbi:MAG TPA: mycothiol synthase [Dermatophilaceae bacterium]|nr:mycothiol synthase [Dermatophilaceae bacterium]